MLSSGNDRHIYCPTPATSWKIKMESLYHAGVDLFLSDRFCLYRNIAAVIGVCWFACLVWRQLKVVAGWFCAFFLAPWGISRINLKKYGPWAVVTGASEGIGRGYALELARRGLNVVIMSRSEEKLQKVANEIRERYGREVRVVPVDFSEGQHIYPALAEQIQDLNIGILINNVGLGYQGPKLLDEVSAGRVYRMVEINCQSMIQMTKLLLPKMLEHKRGIVVNISSASSLFPMQMSAVYSATKIFVNYFSECTRKEYSGQGIIVQNVAPFFVATAMSGMKFTNSFVMDANYYARSAVATIGIQSFTFGCLSHAVQGYVMKRVPACILNPMIWRLSKLRRKRHFQDKAKPE